MDVDVLHAKNVNPMNVRRAKAADMALLIGERATLIPHVAAVAHGFVMDLTHEELDLLYSGPVLALYRPEALIVQLTDGKAVAALCYNLAEPPQPGAYNEEYAEKLKRLFRKLGIPSTGI